MSGSSALDERDWPAVEFAGVEQQASARYSGLRELTPHFTRRPVTQWCVVFFDACQVAFGRDWKEAGFVSCRAGEENNVSRRLMELVDEANDQFREHLKLVNINQPEQLQQLVVLDGALEASDHEGRWYRCGYVD